MAAAGLPAPPAYKWWGAHGGVCGPLPTKKTKKGTENRMQPDEEYE